MNIRLIDVYASKTSVHDLFSLLFERTKLQSISHKRMPTFEEHCDFVSRHPYKNWYIIVGDSDDVYGSIYLTERNEIGLFIFLRHQGLGIAKRALEELKQMHRGPFLANVAPGNLSSQGFFQRQGFKLIQHTYEWIDDRR